MAKPLEFFDEFFAAPEKMRAQEFYMYVHEWLDYLKEHEGEFNYLEDEEWRERKDRVLAVLTEQQENRYEFEDFEEMLDAIDEYEDDDKIAIYQDWVAFMKKNQWNYNISDEDLADLEVKTKDLIISILDCKVIEERLKRNRAGYQKSLAELDEMLSEYHVRTGRRIVMTALSRKFRKRLKGN